MIRFTCGCGRTLQARPDQAGGLAVCPACDRRHTIPPPEYDDIPTAEIDTYWEPPSVPRTAPAPAPMAHAVPVLRHAPEEADDWPDLPQPAPHPVSNWCWRWCSPSMLGLCLLMLPLPFLEVQCHVLFGSGPTLAQQSGLQIMTGGYSIARDVDLLENQMGVGRVPGAGPIAVVARKQQLPVESASLMIAVPVLLLLGAALGLVIGPTKLRVPIVAGCIVGSLAVVFVQMALGFPLERQVRESLDREVARRAKGGNPMNIPGVPPPVEAQIFAPFDRLTSNMVGTHYTGWFWMWLVLMVFSAGPLIGEAVWANTRRPERRRRPLYDPYYG